MQDVAWEKCGEVSEGWLENFKKESEKKLRLVLEAAFNEWAKKEGEYPIFGLCGRNTNI